MSPESNPPPPNAPSPSAVTRWSTRASSGPTSSCHGREGGRPVLYTHIFTSHPFFSSFVIPFAIARIHRGTYGTRLSASLPEALGSWGYVDRIKLTLRRKYAWRGKQLSYFNAGCPAPAHSPRTVFPLALATFNFEEGASISAKVAKSCGVKE